MKKIAIAFIILSMASCAKKNGDIKTVITSFVGNVTVNGKTVDSEGLAVKSGDLIQTGEESFCELIINEQNILRISNNTRLVFNISDTESVLELKQGWLAGLTRKIFKNDRTFLVRTPTVVAAVRGTSFCTKVENPDSTYFCVCNGKIELKKSGGETGDMVISPHHTARRYKKEKDGTLTIEKDPGLLYHDDKGVETLAKKINTTIDWTRVE